METDSIPSEVQMRGKRKKLFFLAFPVKEGATIPAAPLKHYLIMISNVMIVVTSSLFSIVLTG